MAKHGTNLQEQASGAARDLSIYNTRQVGISGLRSELSQYAEALGRPAALEDVPLQTIIADLTGFVQDVEAAAQNLVDRLGNIETALDDLSLAQDAVAEATAALKKLTEEQVAVTASREEAERRIAQIRELASRAQTLRTSKVKQVFNDELNSVWRNSSSGSHRKKHLCQLLPSLKPLRDR